MATTAVDLDLVSLPDIAALAHVRRPVVSVWRSRSAGSQHPFPDPRARVRGQELFALDEVVDWLEATRRGNNPEARQDAALVASLDVLPVDRRDVVLDGLLALLALKAVLGSQLAGLSAADLLDLADDVDPRDDCLYREVAALGHDAPAWAARADALAAAAFTTAAAAGALMARLRRSDGESATALAPAVLDLVARLVVAPAAPDTLADLLLVDPTGTGDLLAAVRDRLGESPRVQLPPAGTAAARRARRLLLATGWDVADAPSDDGLMVVAAGATVVAHLPAPCGARSADEQVLTALADIAVMLPPDARAVVLGPAGALTDRAPLARQAERATVLRSGRVRAVVRLPAGLWPARSRQRMALWVFGPGPSDVRSSEHRTAVADLSDQVLDDAAIEDLVVDVVASGGSRAELHGHAFRFARRVVTQQLIAAQGDLVTPHGPVHRARTASAATALRVSRLVAQAGAPVPGPPAVTVRHHEPTARANVTMASLLAAGHLTLVPGARLDPSDVTQTSGVPVHTAADLRADRTPTAHIDRLAFSAYPRARYTRPGDVVFVTGQHPAARVDHDGFSAVLAPARVLRIGDGAPAGLLPEVIVRSIGGARARGPWRSWQVPLVPTSQAQALRDALTGLAAAREGVAARVDALDALAETLLDAVVTGTLTLDPAPDQED